MCGVVPTLQLIDDRLVGVSLDVQEVDARVLAASDDADALAERHDGTEGGADRALRLHVVETLLEDQRAVAVCDPVR